MKRPILPVIALALALAACAGDHIIGSIDRGEAGVMPDMPVPPSFDRILHLPSTREINLRVDSSGTFRWSMYSCNDCVGDAGRWEYAIMGGVTLLPPVGRHSILWPINGGAFVSSVERVDFIGGSAPVSSAIGFMEQWFEGRVCAVCCGGLDGGVTLSDLGVIGDLKTPDLGTAADLGVAPTSDLGAAVDMSRPVDMISAGDLSPVAADMSSMSPCRPDGGQVTPLRIELCSAPSSGCSLP